MTYARRPRTNSLSLLAKFSFLLAGAAIAASVPLSASAAEVEVASTVTRLYSYANGDVIIEVANPPSTCVAFWLNPANAGGFKNSSAMALSAYHTQVYLRIVAENTELWPGSGQPHCRVTAVALD